MFELVQVGQRSFYIENPTKIGLYKLSESEVCLIDSGNDKSAARKVRQLLDERGKADAYVEDNLLLWRSR